MSKEAIISVILWPAIWQEGISVFHIFDELGEGKKINIIGDDSYHRDQFEIMPIKFHKFTKKRV